MIIRGIIFVAPGFLDITISTCSYKYTCTCYDCNNRVGC